MTKARAIAELVFAGALWGFGFIATKWALQSYTTYEVLNYRYFIAALIGELFLFIFLIFGKTTKKKFIFYEPTTIKNDLKITFWAGLLMAFFILPQTIGLETTTATKSGFLTVLYILIVPLIQHFFMKIKLNTKIYFAVLMGLFGVALLVNIFHEKNLVRGDLWTLVCAVFAALHILYVGKVAIKSHSPFRFNNFQSFWCFLFLLPFLLAQENIHWISSDWISNFGVLFMALGSSVIAFTAQVRAQRVLSSTTASMLFLLESPFALLFGFALLNETLQSQQLLGALIILISAVLVVRWEHEPSNSTKMKSQ